MECVYDKIDLDLREEIFNAVLKEFSKKSYKDASTNEIVKNCSISKGTLYNYFKSKEELYFQTLTYCIRELSKYYDDIFKDVNIDFILALKISLDVKQKLISKYPTVFQFVEKCWSDATKPNVEKCNSILFSPNVVKHQTQLKEFGFTDLKPGLDEEEVKQMILDVMDGVAYKYINNGIDINQSFDICNDRLKLIEILIMEDK